MITPPNWQPDYQPPTRTSHRALPIRPRRLRRLLALAGLGAVITGATIGTAVGRADPETVQDYANANAGPICQILMNDPTSYGVEEILRELQLHNVTPYQSGEVLYLSVSGYCPTLLSIVTAWANAQKPSQVSHGGSIGGAYSV